MGLQPIFRKLRRQRIIIIIIAAAFTLGIILIVGSHKYKRIDLSIQNEREITTSDLYSINTAACKIPNLQHIYPGPKPIIPRSPSCRKAKDVASIKDDDQVVMLGERFADNKYECTVSEIFGSGTEVRFSKPEPIFDSIDVSEKELIITRCGDFYNLDANFPVNLPIQQKLDEWDALDEIPFSVLLIGFGNYSRSTFHSNVPKSVRSMLELMGFIEFQGYHSVAPSPLENFLGFLGGMNSSAVHEKCHPNRHSSFDNCSLIWKSFQENNYVTMLMEDGSDTFSWDGMKGFLKKPTDFYTHPLFQSRAQLRKEFPVKGLSELCVSRLNPQAFLYEYTQRFYKKFLDYPFFAFVWSNYMTHAKSRFTSGTDDGLSKVLYTLRAFPESLERTLVIITSDTGSATNGPIGILENSLPGLFIRVPELLEKKFPDLQFNKTLKTNSKRLVTGLDIHHTLEHLLVLNGMSFSATKSKNNDVRLRKISLNNFEPILQDRSSLLVPISETRKCSDVNILESKCICNASKDTPAWNDPLSKILMIDFVIQELNDIIKGSLYNDKCLQYIPGKAPILSTDMINVEKNFTDGFLTFAADPHRREFKVIVRVIHVESLLDRFERRSEFSRVSEKNKDSWCSKMNEIDDEVVKNLCTC